MFWFFHRGLSPHLQRADGPGQVTGDVRKNTLLQQTRSLNTTLTHIAIFMQLTWKHLWLLIPGFILANIFNPDIPAWKALLAAPIMLLAVILPGMFLSAIGGWAFSKVGLDTRLEKLHPALFVPLYLVVGAVVWIGGGWIFAVFAGGTLDQLRR